MLNVFVIAAILLSCSKRISDAERAHLADLDTQIIGLDEKVSQCVEQKSSFLRELGSMTYNFEKSKHLQAQIEESSRLQLKFIEQRSELARKKDSILKGESPIVEPANFSVQKSH